MYQRIWETLSIESWVGQRLLERTSEIVQLLVKSGAQNFPLAFGFACHGGHMPIAKLMIQFLTDDYDSHRTNKFHQGVLSNSDCEWGCLCACRGGHLDIAQFTIQNGAENWKLGLTNACVAGNATIVEMIIRNGSKNFSPEDWKHAFGNACFQGSKLIVEILIQHITKLEISILLSPIWTFGLVRAACGGHFEIFEMILKNSNGITTMTAQQILLAASCKMQPSSIIELVQNDWNHQISAVCNTKLSGHSVSTFFTTFNLTYANDLGWTNNAKKRDFAMGFERIAGRGGSCGEIVDLMMHVHLNKTNLFTCAQLNEALILACESKDLKIIETQIRHGADEFRCLKKEQIDLVALCWNHGLPLNTLRVLNELCYKTVHMELLQQRQIVTNCAVQSIDVSSLLMDYLVC